MNGLYCVLMRLAMQRARSTTQTASSAIVPPRVRGSFSIGRRRIGNESARAGITARQDTSSDRSDEKTPAQSVGRQTKSVCSAFLSEAKSVRSKSTQPRLTKKKV